MRLGRLSWHASLENAIVGFAMDARGSAPGIDRSRLSADIPGEGPLSMLGKHLVQSAQDKVVQRYIKVDGQAPQPPKLVGQQVECRGPSGSLDAGLLCSQAAVLCGLKQRFEQVGPEVAHDVDDYAIAPPT